MFSAKDLKCVERPHGIVWTVKIVKQGKIVGSCSNDGRGGYNDYLFPDMSIRAEFMNAAKQKYPQSVEPESYYIEDLIAPLEA